LIGATVIDVNNSNNNTISDEQGIAYINNPTYPLTIKVSFIGL
jgi:hypothetical protein